MDDETSSSSPPILEIDGLEKRYGRVSALGGLSLTVREGEVFGFLGRNGAGKSTAIRIVMGITQADGGAHACSGRPRGVTPSRFVSGSATSPRSRTSTAG